MNRITNRAKAAAIAVVIEHPHPLVLGYYSVHTSEEALDKGEDQIRRIGAALRREFPDVAFHDFESWAKAQDWNTLLQGP
jgi:hypothetical protein